jgi:hypothetical protein
MERGLFRTASSLFFGGIDINQAKILGGRAGICLYD